MHWLVLNIPARAPTLLTSDRPVLRTSNIAGPQGHIALPIGPRLLFISSPDADFLNRVLKADQIGLAREVNRQVVEGAAKFVYSADDKQDRFIGNRFGMAPQSRTTESLFEMRALRK